MLAKDFYLLKKRENLVKGLLIWCTDKGNEWFLQ